MRGTEVRGRGTETEYGEASVWGKRKHGRWTMIDDDDGCRRRSSRGGEREMERQRDREKLIMQQLGTQLLHKRTEPRT